MSHAIHYYDYAALVQTRDHGHDHGHDHALRVLGRCGLDSAGEEVRGSSAGQPDSAREETGSMVAEEEEEEEAGEMLARAGQLADDGLSLSWMAKESQGSMATRPQLWVQSQQTKMGLAAGELLSLPSWEGWLAVP